MAYASSFLLPGRVILQQIHQESVSWDDDVPERFKVSWRKWRDALPQLEKLKIPRCYKPEGFKSVSASIHSFSDASDYGYGSATYLR